MLRQLQRIKRLVAAVAAGLVYGTSLLTPFLERERPGSVTIEAQHDGNRCSPLHDHGVCVQLQHARALPEIAPVALPHIKTSAEQRPSAQDETFGSYASGKLHARAPPAV